MDTWDILDDDGEVTLSLRQVLQYKYLGLESFLSVTETCKKKQQKCISTAHKYKCACHHIGRRGPDVVETTLATRNNIAIPAILLDAIQSCSQKIRYWLLRRYKLRLQKVFWVFLSTLLTSVLRQSWASFPSGLLSTKLNYHSTFKCLTCLTQGGQKRHW